MPHAERAVTFADRNLYEFLTGATDAGLDEAEFGVIGFDAGNLVRRYNRFESKCAGLAPGRVLGLDLFTAVAPCMNNFMVAQRFEDATLSSTELDAIIDYVLTLRMRPIKVKLRLLSMPGRSIALRASRPPLMTCRSGRARRFQVGGKERQTWSRGPRRGWLVTLA